MKYDNILNNLGFEDSRAKVKVTVAILEKHCHRSCIFNYLTGFALTSHKC